MKTPHPAWRALTAVLAAGGLGAWLLAGSGAALASAHPAVAKLRITTTSLPAATKGTAYTAKLTAAGGTRPFSWSVTAGSLPAGLTLAPATGRITGRATATGPSEFTVTVTDSEDPAVTVNAAESITVNARTLAVKTSTLPDATTQVAYSAKLAAVGGIRPYRWSLAAGSLPVGLKLHAFTGVISGTSLTTGTADFTVAVTDAETPAATATVQLTIDVVAPLQVTTTDLPQGEVLEQYTGQLAAAGGAAPYTWSVASGQLPPGLSLDPASGVISGLPADDGDFPVTVAVTDSESPAASVQAAFVILVEPQLTLPSSALPEATQGQPYQTSLQAAGGYPPYAWSATGLPSGLTINPATGQITGPPTESGAFTFQVLVTDSNDPPATTTATETIFIAAPLTITSTQPPEGIQGISYDFQLTASGGYAPYTWSADEADMPPGLVLQPNGEVVGAPAAPGVFFVEMTVTDSRQPADSTTALVTFNIAPGPQRARASVHESHRLW